MRSVFHALVALLLACGPSSEPADSPPDAGPGDVGAVDAGRGDASPRDAVAGDDAGGGMDAALDAAFLRDAEGPEPDARVPPTSPRFVGFWGGLGTAPGQFIEPSSVEVDSDGFVYVAGHEDRFQKFTREGVLVDIFGEPGGGDGQFDHPHGLAIDRSRGDLVYIGDQENHRLQVFTPDGSFVRLWGDAGFQHIHDIGIDRATGDLFVPDYELMTIRRFSPAGEELASFGGFGRDPGRFDGAWGVSTDSDGFLYVADTFNRRVQKLEPDGTFVQQLDGFGATPFVKPTGVYVDSADVVHVCDSLAARVYLFSTEGEPLEEWALDELVGFATEPEDVVVDDAGVHVYVAEVRQHRVLHLVR